MFHKKQVATTQTNYLNYLFFCFLLFNLFTIIYSFYLVKSYFDDECSVTQDTKLCVI